MGGVFVARTGLLAILAALRAISAACPGKVSVQGHGEVFLTGAEWESPGIPARPVHAASGSEVRPRLSGRAYFADRCVPGSYSNTEYTALKLLGKRIRYTVSLPGATCGCSASLHLAPLRQSRAPAECGDHYCDAAGSCGAVCAQIDIQEANSHAWRSALHTGAGGDVGESGGLFLGLNASQYGPHAACIDTRWPFQVSASFPIDASGSLVEMEVTLMQFGKTCPLTLRVGGAPGLLEEMTSVLADGVTPVVSYWAAEDMAWLDGHTGRGEGPCKADTPWQCADSVRFADFAIEPLPGTQVEEPSAAPGPLPDQTGRGKTCVDGWQQPPACAEKFEYKGRAYEGCTWEDYREPWCSADSVFAGRRLTCDSCGTPPPGERPQARRPSATRAVGPAGVVIQAPEAAAAHPPASDPDQHCEWNLRVARSVVHNWDQFTIVGVPEDPIVSIRTAHGRFLGVGADGVARADLDAAHAGALSIRQSRPNGPVAIATASGAYLSVAPDGSVHARPAAAAAPPGKQERFYLMQHSDGNVSLRTYDWRFLISERMCVPACALNESSYVPMDMPGRTGEWAVDADSCQAVCAAVPGCAHFTFLRPDQTCHLADGSAGLRVGTTGAVAGPAACPGAPDRPSASTTTTSPAPPAPTRAPPTTRTPPPTPPLSPPPPQGPPAVPDCDFPLRFEEEPVPGWDSFEWVVMGRDQVSLLTFHGLFVGTTPDGRVRADIPPGGPEPPEKFDVIWFDAHNVALRTSQGRYLAARSDGTLDATSMSVGEQALLSRMAEEDRSVAFRSWRGQRLMADRVCVPGCAMPDAAYLPGTVAGQSGTRKARDAAMCQALCGADANCAHFTFVQADRSCTFADANASLQVGRVGSIAGPRRCMAGAGGESELGGAAAGQPGRPGPSSSQPADPPLARGSAEVCQYPLRAHGGADPAAAKGWDVFEWMVDDDGLVTLLTFHDRCVGVRTDGSAVGDFEGAPTQSTKFSIDAHRDGSLSLVSFQGKYLSISPEGWLNAMAVVVGERERFRLNPQEDGTVILTAWNNQTLVAEKICTPSCAAVDYLYVPEGVPVDAPDALACQEWCARLPSCAYFSFTQVTRACHLSGAGAELQASLGAASAAGPARCDGSEDPTGSQPFTPPNASAATTVTLPETTTQAPETTTAAVEEEEEDCEVVLRIDRGTSRQGWDAFEWIRQGGKWVSLLTFHGTYATPGPDGRLHADVEGSLGTAGRFQVVGRPDGAFSLRTTEGLLVVAGLDGVLRAEPGDADGDGDGDGGRPNERALFRLMPYEDGTVTLEAWNGKTVTAEKLCTPRCAKVDTSYLPLDFGGRQKTWARDAIECQAHCAAQPGCAFFTYVPEDGSCHFSDGRAEEQVSHDGAVAGPVTCRGSLSSQPTPARPVTPAPAPMTPSQAFLGSSSVKEATTTKTRRSWGSFDEEGFYDRGRNMTECQWPIQISTGAHPDWERFLWQELTPNSARLRTAHGRYLAVAADGHVDGRARRHHDGTADFSVVWHGENTFSLKTPRGFLVTVNEDGSMQENPSRRVAGKKESLVRVPRGDGTYALFAWTGDFLAADKSCMPVCAQEMSAYEPVDSMLGQHVSRGGDPSSCQARCGSTLGCQGFTFQVADRSCHLADSKAVLQVGIPGALAGPSRCQDMMVMRRYIQPDLAVAPFGAFGDQQPWAVWALVATAVAALPACIGLVMIVSRRAAAKRVSDTARSVSFMELLPAGVEDESLE